jgi:hypothetical protein
MSVNGMRELAEQLYNCSLQLEFFPERKKRGLDPGIELMIRSSIIKQKIVDLHNENSSMKINLTTHDIVVTPKPNMVLKYCDVDTVEAMSRILLHDRYVGSRKCWLKYQEESPEK